MRVLLISHTCQSRHAGQPKAAHLAQMPNVELRVLVPDRWFEYGQWKHAQKPLQSTLDLQAGKVLWPWAGPAQWYLHWYPRMAQMIRQFQPDIIDVWEEPWGLVSVQTCWLRDRFAPRARIIVETEQNILKTLPPPFEQFRSYTLRRADFAIGRNRESLQVLREKGYNGPSQVVPNAVDAELFRPLDRAACRAQVAAQIGLANSAFLVGYAGRLVEEKGLMDLIDALEFCAPDVHLLFVGEGDYGTALRGRTQQTGKHQQVHFLPPQPFEQLPFVMNALDVFALPSRTTPSWKEQFGRVIIEAHACQTPVIGADSGAIAEVVGTGGVVVPERDPKSLGAAITALQNDGDKCRQMGRIGRRQVEESYTWQQVALRMNEIYRRVLS